MGESSGVTQEKYADSFYHKFSNLVKKRRTEDVSQKLYAANRFSEKVLAITYANHHHSVALFAIVAYCCVHVNINVASAKIGVSVYIFQIYQVNIPMFACAIAALFCPTNAQQLVLKIVGTYLSGLMIFHVMKPILVGEEFVQNTVRILSKQEVFD